MERKLSLHGSETSAPSVAERGCLREDREGDRTGCDYPLQGSDKPARSGRRLRGQDGFQSALRTGLLCTESAQRHRNRGPISAVVPEKKRAASIRARAVRIG